MFSTKQEIVILLAQPLNGLGLPLRDPTVRDLQRGLKEYFRNNITRRHIRKLLRELTHEGAIERDFNAWHFAPHGNQAQATRYRLVDFNRAFQDHHCLIERSKVILARERKRIKRRGLAARDRKVVL